MKKVLAILLASLLVFTLLSGCGSSRMSAGSATNEAGDMTPGAAPSAAPQTGYGYDKGYAEDSKENYSSSTKPGSQSDDSNSSASVNMSEKIIYTASGEVETVDFDGSLEKLYSLLGENGAFLENSYVSGVNYKSSYYNNQSFRYATFTIRVPSASFGRLTDLLSELGNVIYLSTDTDNITSRFYDLEARLRTYETEEERLLTMLQSAKTVEDMILIEERLSNVRYNIESAQTTLNSWQTQVDYSTVNLRISEVEELTEKTETHLTYAEEISQGFRASLKSVGGFFKELFKNLIVALPVIVIIAVAAAAVIIVAVRSAKKRLKKRQPKDINPK